MQADASPYQSLQPFKESVGCKLVFSIKHPKSARQPTSQAPDSTHKSCESAQQGLIASHCPLALSMVAPSLLTRPLLLPNKRPPRPFTPCNHPLRDMASLAANHAAVHVDDPHAPPLHQQVHLGHTQLTMGSLNCLMSDSNA